MKQLYACILFFLLVMSQRMAYAQPNILPCAPNCTDINASIIPDPQGQGFIAKIFWTDIISNFDCAEPVTYALRRGSSGPTSSGGSSDDVGNQEYFLISDPCAFLDGGLQVIIQNDLGMCISNVTFKRGEPSIIGRSTTVYCNDSIIDYPSVYINGVPPTSFISCQGLGPVPEHAGDWIDNFPCGTNPANDTLKIIRREWEVFDKEGKRAFAFDTIHVLRLPRISTVNTYCGQQDTVYCGDADDCIGPYFVYEEDPTGAGADIDGDLSVCDTIKFIEVEQGIDGLEFHAAEFDDKCGLLVDVKSWRFDDDCSPQYKVEVTIKEVCPRAVLTTPLCLVPGVGNVLENLGVGYWRCEFWLMDLDTVPPKAECKYDKVGPDRLLSGSCFDPIDVPNIEPGDSVIVVSTNTHDCTAHTYIPPLCVYDDWSGIKQVKASAEGLGSWILTPADSCDEVEYGICYESHQRVPLTKKADGSPHEILYEIYDNCHNVDTAYCYILVKDLVKPVAVVDKGLTVSVSDKKVWVGAEEFDENSYDNCGINLFLARRTDWYEQIGGCVDLCDSINYCCVGPHKDTLWIALLEPNKHKDDTSYRDDVEAHYAKNLDWWCNDGTACGSLIYNAWQYDLMKHATLKCRNHPYGVDEEYFQEHFTSCYYDFRFYGPAIANADPDLSTFHDIDPKAPVEYCFDKFKPLPSNLGCTHLNGAEFTIDDIRAEVDLYERLGGGWSDAVPFGCDDACGPVTVELLAMDYWCNWSIAWTTVWVEDKTPVTIAKDVLEELEISCKTYKEKKYDFGDLTHQLSIDEIVALAKDGDPEALDSLDAIFGGYQKAWLDPYGNYVDKYGNEVICDIPFQDSFCDCRDTTQKFRVFDEHHGYIWKDSSYRVCEYFEDDRIYNHGIVRVNCSENVHCEQTVWCDFDHCGEGYIFRKFKIWQGCPDTSETYQSGHIPDTIIRHQRIWVGNNCTLDKYMFDVPQDTTVTTCGLTYDESGSGNLSGDLHPDNTGYPKYLFDDDCRVVGIGHQDKVFKIVGGDEVCYKILRTFYFADWCGGKPVSENWFKNDDLVLDSCVQKILVIDTEPPVCLISGPVDDGGTVEVSACQYDLNVEVAVKDSCGASSYEWELTVIKDDQGSLVDDGNGLLNGDTSSSFVISSQDLLSGDYKLTVQVKDDCQNEGLCEYYFTVATGKKPSPVCITSLTADLTPWDLDQDGTADTAKAVVWAYEFDRSSSGPCGEEGDSLSFYIEFLSNDVNQDSFDITRLADSLALGCEHLGTHQVRMWVVSSTGSADFCDVILMVSNNAGFCEPINTEQGALSGIFENEVGETIEKVEVSAESTQALSNISTGEDGNYEFNAPMGAVVTLTPSKDIEPQNGVTTMDLVHLLGHISGDSLLPTPYRILAADANRDGFINALDLLEVRQLVLGEIATFSNSESWRFILKEYEFVSENPESEPVPERATFSVDEPEMRQDFIGMKVGDMDLDAKPDQSAPRGRNDLVLAVDDQELIAGETYLIPILTTEFNQVMGYQFTLNVDPGVIKIVNVKAGTTLDNMDWQNYGYTHLDQGRLTTSWNTTVKGTSLAKGETIVTLEVVAQKNVKLSDAMSIGSQITTAESYRVNGQYGGVALDFQSIDGPGESVILYQNLPNPIQQSTWIDFYLPVSDQITFTITDVSGKVLYNIDGRYPAGRHTLAFDKFDLAASQVLFYSLETSRGLITKRMIVTR